MCKTLKVSASGFYDWSQRPLSQRQQANATLTTQIRAAFVASDETYGMPRIRAELQDAGIVASRKRIARLMRLAQIRGVSRRRSFCVTTERDVRHRPAPDLVKREFVATDINQLWVADMTYIPTWAGFLYLSVVIDVYSRKVVGWAFGERMTSDPVIQALNIALMTRKPESVIHHSDQGSQYTSIAFDIRTCFDLRPTEVTTVCEGTQPLLAYGFTRGLRHGAELRSVATGIGHLTVAEVPYSQAHQIARPQFAVQPQVKKRKLTYTLAQLQPYANCPDVF